MLNRLDESDRVLLICTPTYYRRFRGHEEPGKGKGVDWEGAVITQEIYDARSATTRFIPVLFDPADEVSIPEPVRGQTRYCLTSESAYQDLYDALLESGGCRGRRAGPAQAPGAQARPTRGWPRRRPTTQSLRCRPLGLVPRPNLHGPGRASTSATSPPAPSTSSAAGRSLRRSTPPGPRAPGSRWWS